MESLGKYADIVLISYGMSLVLLALILGLTWAQSVKARRVLKDIEGRDE